MVEGLNDGDLVETLEGVMRRVFSMELAILCGDGVLNGTKFFRCLRGECWGARCEADLG